ncbi:MAG: hypothetical protein AAGI38_00870 [Bacteroidota bacterium]
MNRKVAEVLIPAVAIICITSFVGYNIFSRMPSNDERQKEQATRLQHKEKFDTAFTPYEFTAVVTNIQRRLRTKEFIGNTRYEVSIDVVNPVNIPNPHDKDFELFNLADPSSSWLYLSALDGRFVKKGDTLVKKPGVAEFVVVSTNSRKEVVYDTLGFGWKLFIDPNKKYE